MTRIARRFLLITWVVLASASCAENSRGEATGATPSLSEVNATISEEALGLIQRACKGEVPKVVADAIPGAVSQQNDDAPGGTSCSWHVPGESADSRALLLAYDQGSLIEWRQLTPGSKEDTEVDGRQVVLSNTAANCTALFEIDATVVSADITGTKKSDCSAVVELVEGLLIQQ